MLQYSEYMYLVYSMTVVAIKALSATEITSGFQDRRGGINVTRTRHTGKLYVPNLVKLLNSKYPSVWASIGGFIPPRTSHHAYCNTSSCCVQLHILYDLIRSPNFTRLSFLEILRLHLWTQQIPQRNLSDLSCFVSCLLIRLSLYVILMFCLSLK